MDTEMNETLVEGVAVVYTDYQTSIERSKGACNGCVADNRQECHIEGVECVEMGDACSTNCLLIWRKKNA